MFKYKKNENTLITDIDEKRYTAYKNTPKNLRLRLRYSSTSTL